MGILRGRRNDGDVRRFRMREKLASVGDHLWIEDEQRNRAYEPPNLPRTLKRAGAGVRTGLA